MDESSEHLTIYLDRIHSFLISNDNSLVFPSLTMSVEDILVNIARDTNFLKQSRFGVDCKSLVAKLLAVLDKNKDVFTLGHEFKFDDKRKKVMVYKKIPVHAFQEPISVPSKPLRKPNSIKEKTGGNTQKSVMSSFKITFLNATLKFVKDDSQMALSYPNMSSEQADFVKQMIDQCMERDGTKAGFKGLYDPLVEALKIFSLKYDFKLSVGTLGDMKKLRFEKTRKITATNKREGTRIIYEETTDSDCSLKQVGKSKSQKKLSTLIDAMSQTTPTFKLLTLTELKDFLKDKMTSIHTFSNLTVQEQQFISQWQALAQRVEVMKLLDVKGQMVLDEIRGFLKNKNFKVKVELGMTASRDRFAKLMKVYNPNNVKLSEEQKIARLKAMVLPSQTRRAIAAGNSSSNSSSDTNSKPQSKFERKVAKFFRKTKGVKNDWIQATLTRLRDFLQDEAEASLYIRSITELQTSFLAKWQNLLSEPEVINTYPTDVQVLMHEVRDVASATKKKFRVEFNLTKFKTGLRDARFSKLPAFYTPPNQVQKENVPVNILHKNNGNKTENALDFITNVNKTSRENVPGNIPPKNNGNKTENALDSITNVNKTTKENVPGNILTKNKDNKTENALDTVTNVNKTTKENVPGNILTKNNGNKTENALDSITNVNKTSKENVPGNILTKNNGNKTENGTESIKNESGNKQSTNAVKLDPKKGSKSYPCECVISTVKAAVPTNTKSAAKFEPNVGGNKGEVVAQKAAVPKATLAAAVKLEPKPGGNKVAPKTIKCLPENKAIDISKQVDRAMKAALKKEKLTAPVKFEPKQSDDKAAKIPANATKARDANDLRSGSIANLYRTVCKKINAAENQRKDVPPGAIHRSASLTSLNKKDRPAKNAGKVVRLPAATVKLIEALNQPLVSERGMKMMRQMGWEGGPLGVRGEGIAEPIMPGIDLGKRAGLGAPKPNLQVLVAASKLPNDNDYREGVVNSVDNNFKQGIIQTLLRMVEGEEPQRTEIKFNHELTLPDWNYVKIVATSFNNREVYPEGMSAVLARVTDEELMLTAACSWAKTDILLIISKYNEEIKINREQWSYLALPKETLWKRNKKRLVEVSATRDVDKRVMVTGQAFKYYVMAQILDFCLNCKPKTPLAKEVIKDIILKGTMDKKQRSYVRDVVTRVNSSARCSSVSGQEVAIHDEIISAMQGKGYRITVDFPSLEEISGNPVYNVIRLTKIYGYRAKTVLVKLPPVKTEAITANNNCSTKENNNLQVKAVIKKNKQELTKNGPENNKQEVTQNEHKHLTKTTQDTNVDNKENNILTVNITENKVKNPVVIEIHTKPNNKKVDETITNDIKINKSGSETENTRKDEETVNDCCNDSAMIKIDKHKDDDKVNKHNKTDKKDTGKDNNLRKTAVDEEKVSVEYIILEKQITETVNDIENTDRLKGTEKDGHNNNNNNKDNNDKTEGFNDKQNSHSIQSTSTESESVKDNIIDRDLSTIDNEKMGTTKNDNASRLIESIQNITNAKADITSDNKSFKTIETEKTVVACQGKTYSESDKTQLLESIDNIAGKIHNVTITKESSKTTEKPVVLCQIDKEIDRSGVEEKIPPINDIIASLVEINIAGNTESEKVIDITDVPTVSPIVVNKINITENTESEKVIGITDVPSVSPIEVNKENNKKDQTLKRLSKRIRSKALSSDRAHKRTKYDYVKHINIKPKDYPQTKITNKIAAEIQKSIQQSIDYTQVLPLLKCHGIQDGVLSYSCHNEKSLEIIQNILKPFDFNVTMTEESEKGTCKMSLRLNTYIDESVKSVFNNLETFNLGLSTKDWVFIKKEQYSDFIVIFVNMDMDSYKFIRDENFKLYAGIDEAQFSIVWG